jgi:hypothetical protein
MPLASSHVMFLASSERPLSRRKRLRRTLLPEDLTPRLRAQPGTFLTSAGGKAIALRM